MSNPILAYHLDLKRPMWRQDYLAALVKKLAAWGYNLLVLELEDKFRFDQHPAISHPEALSHQSASALVAACRAQGLAVVPLVQSLGHAEYVLSKPEYASLRESPQDASQYDPLSTDARTLICRLFDEVIDAVRPREFFHMGGDECRVLGTSSRARELAKKIGIGGLYLQHMLPLLEHVHRRGLRPVIWADMILKHPEIIPKVPRYCVIMDWDYWTREERPATAFIWGGDPQTGNYLRLAWDQYRTWNNPDLKRLIEPLLVDEQTRRDGTFRGFYCADLLRSMGFDVLTAAANRCASVKTGIPIHDLHMANCFFSVRKGITAGLGTLVTSWAVRHCNPEVLHPATFAASQAFSGRTTYDFQALCRAFTAEYYGAEMPEFGPTIVKAGARLSMAEASPIEMARKSFRQGQDPIPGALERLRQVNPEMPPPDLNRLVADFTEARAAFAGMRERAKINAHNFDFWIEGMDLDLFYARFMLAALEGRLKEQAANLLSELEDARKRSRSLLAETYLPLGVEDELEQRYGFHAEYLRNLT